jgi:hypothetical protein
MARNSINAEINQAVKNLYDMLDKYNTAISKKTLLKRAGRVALSELKQQAGAIKRTGNLQKSAQWINTRSKSSVLAGFNYRRGGSHAHLIEFGWVTKNGNRVKGRPIVKITYEKTKDQILQNLINEMQKTQAKIEREIRI